MIEWFNSLVDERKRSVFRFVASIFFTSMLTFIVSLYNNYRSKKEIETLIVESREMKRQLYDMQERYNELQIELIKCQGNYGSIETGLDDLPIPAYIIKANTFEVSYVNRAYVNFYLSPRGLTKMDIIGTSGQVAFGKDAIKDFHWTNRLVVSTGKAHSRKEIVDSVTLEKRMNVKSPIYQFGHITHIIGLSYESL